MNDKTEPKALIEKERLLNNEFYQRGFHDGYRTGMYEALKPQIMANMLKTSASFAVEAIVAKMDCFHKVYQTKFGKPEGNCLGACVASIFGFDEIPEFEGNAWWEKLVMYCDRLGFEVLYFAPNNREWFFEENLPDVYCIGSGMGKRGLLHSVVFKGKEMIHDPFPDGDGIEMPPKDWVFFIPKTLGLRVKPTKSAENLNNDN